MNWCSRCLMPDTRPRVRFTDGVCNACVYHEQKKQIDWTAREAEFQETIRGAMEQSKQSVGAGWGCVVPFSGGKDSAAVAWKLREAGLRPLLVTYGQLLWTDVGRSNFNRVCDSGFDILYWRVDQRVSKLLARRFFIERGHPKQHYDAGVNAVPLITAAKFKIPLVFYAEHGETEYGGNVLSEESRRTRNLHEVLENQVGDDPANWMDGGIVARDLLPYRYPSAGELGDCHAFYFSYFFPWDIYENAKFARSRGFDCAQNGQSGWGWGKSDGSFEGYDSIDDKIDDLDYYMMYVKFGFGRSARMASRLIQNGHMTREEGLELVRRYDGEFPSTYWDDVLEYMEMTETEALETIEMHRNEEIWKKENGQWALRNPPS